ncbi:hypothetical protein [Verrucomicrobium sp. BvORR034]|uniref:hypothetical protein n=1 Tax=Verrucomicrobium sp. BvORR034 TaxID=1396418 RepID=UPI00067943D4|nr:hypothetical protein [Verrucomicrobium sp. BvORR034]
MIRILLCSLLAGGLFLPLYGGTSYSPGVETGANFHVEVKSWLETCPQYGLVPLELRIRNGDSRPHTWTLRAGNLYGGGLSTEAKLTVEAESSGRLMVYAPVTPQTDNAYYYGNLGISVEGPGINRPQAGNLHSQGSAYRSNSTEFIAMGRKLSTKGWSGLRGKINGGTGSSSSNNELIGSEVDAKDAPDDWRGYTGLAHLWLDAGEWQGMDAKTKGAVLDWVSLGGRLYVLNAGSGGDSVKELFPMVNGPEERPGKMRHGAGRLEVLTWDGNTFPLDEVTKRVKSGGDLGSWNRLDDYDQKWNLKEKVGKLTLKSGLIFTFILTFGVLIGPVNLFWLAGGGRRHRLFWTTPAIALAGSALLVALMVLQDGTGGSGSRLILATLMPDQKRMTVLQEQVARTGVLMGSSFPVTEPVWMMPLDIDDERVPNFGTSNRDGTFADNGESRWGDWYASRSVQGQLIQTVRPTRAAVEFQPAVGDATPVVLSSLEVPLKKIFIVEEGPRFWVADDLGTGEKKPLRAATEQDFRGWIREKVEFDGGPLAQQVLGPAKGLPGRIYAEAAEAEKLAVPTLGSIRWNDDRLIILGNYVKKL